MNIIYHILSCAVTGLFSALFIVFLAWVGVFPAFVMVKDEEEGDE